MSMPNARVRRRFSPGFTASRVGQDASDGRPCRPNHGMRRRRDRRRRSPGIAHAPEPGAAAVVWAVGDGADGSARAKRLARLIAGDEPDRFLYLGDVYETGSAEEFRRNFAGVYGALAEITAPTPGNHEWGRRREGYYPYWAAVTGRRQRPVVPLPTRRAGRSSASTPRRRTGPGSRQLRWLRRQLDGRARATAGSRSGTGRAAAPGVYGDDASYEPFWRALRGQGAAGAERRTTTTCSGCAPRDGIVQLVAGSGGRELYPLHARRAARVRARRPGRGAADRARAGRGRGWSSAARTGGASTRSELGCEQP